MGKTYKDQRKWDRKNRRDEAGFSKKRKMRPMEDLPLKKMHNLNINAEDPDELEDIDSAE